MNSGMGQIINVDSPTYIESPEQKALWIPEQPKHNEFTSQENCNCFRNLIVYNNTDFNPMQEIAKGRSIISILNEEHLSNAIASTILQRTIICCRNRML